MNTPSTHSTEAGFRGTRTSGARRLKVGLAAVVVFLTTFGGLTVAGITPVGASTLDGNATIANPNGLAQIPSGGSTTQFTVSLPANAACDGDTASHGYHVFSYLIPEGTDPTWESFKTGLPSIYSGLVTATGKYYGAATTAANTGQIISIPTNLEFAPLLNRGLPLNSLLYSNGNTSGVWEAGIACANSSGVVTDYWNTEVTFTSSNSDANGFVWSDTVGPCTSNLSPQIFTASSDTFTQRTANSFTVQSTGCAAPTFSETGALPTGVSLSPTGVLSGTPTQSGSFPITISAAVNGGGTTTQSFTLNLAPATPYAPVIGTAVSGNAQATVNFTAPDSGGSPIISYTVTATDSTNAAGDTTQGGTASPVVVTGLNNGDSYTFKVTATNAVGTGAASATSNVVVPATVPGAPTIGTATAGNQSASVTFTPPGSNGGATITGYTVTATDSTNAAGDTTQGGTASPIVVNGLNNGDSYTFIVAATNSVGTGAASGPSNAVVPVTVPDAPAAPTATAGNTQATVTWTVPYDEGSAITGYVITPYIGATAQTPIDLGPDVTTDNITGLTNGTAYTFTVAATNGVGTGVASAASNAVTPVTVPDAPVVGTATAGNTQASLSFTLDGGNPTEGSPITSYTVTATDLSNALGTQSQSGTASPITVSGLTNGDVYTLSVTATNAVGTSAPSAGSNDVVPATVPNAPAAPTVTAGNKSVTVDWTAPSNEGQPISGYVLTPYIGATAQPAINLGNVLTDQVTGLTNGTAYTFTVAATNDLGTGLASPASVPVTPVTVPDAPPTPSATVGNESATVTWSAPFNEGSAITGYAITTTPYTDPSAQTTIDVGDVTTYDVTGLTVGTVYTFEVAAINGVGTGAASTASNLVRGATFPDQVPTPTATAGTQSATVNWTAPDDEGSPITGYVITPYIGATAQVPVDVGNVTTDDLTGLTAGVAYTFTVAATNGVGTGTASAASNAVTPVTVPDAPVIESALAGNAQAALTWSTPDDEGSAITGYVITPYIGSTAQTAVDVGPVNSDDFTGLTNGTAYTFTVAAINGVGTGAASAASDAVTPATEPGAPTAVKGTAGKGSVKLTWDAPASDGGSAITGYIITPSSGSPVTVGDVTTSTVTRLTNGVAYTFKVAAINGVGTGAASAKSTSVTPDGLYIVTKTLAGGTDGKKYTSVTLTAKDGVGTLTWSATGLPTGLTLSSKGVLAGTVGKSDSAKTYSVTVTVKDSSHPTKQTATAKLSLKVVK